MRVLHIITGLGHGGAEMMLYKLLAAEDRNVYDSHVITLTDVGAVGHHIAALGVPVEALGMRRGIPDPFAIGRLAKLIKRINPDVIQTWMYHANLLGGVAARMAGRIPVIWGLHHSNLDPGANKRSTLWTVHAGARLARLLANHVVCCSNATFQSHLEVGYPADRMSVIPNGFDLQRFKPDEAGRHAIRNELGLRLDVPIVGLVGRYHPLKDHATFIKAAVRIRQAFPDVHFMLCGDDVTPTNRDLTSLLSSLRLEDCFHLLGRRTDMPQIMSAFDVFALSSAGEAFPNVVGEAMACGVPCVVTNVGDCAFIVGEFGRVVPAKDPDSLAVGCCDLLALREAERTKLGSEARDRVAKNFDLRRIAEQYHGLYASFSGDPAVMSN